MCKSKEMIIEPGSKGFSTTILGKISLIKKGNFPGVWEVITVTGDVKFVSEWSFYGFPGKKENPWRKFAQDGDDPPEELSFGFSRFVVGKDIDGEKYPVVFDTMNATWLTTRLPRGGGPVHGKLWEEVDVVGWREL